MRRVTLAAAALAGLTVGAFAQSAEPLVPDSGTASDVNSVFVFNRVCYGQVPNIDGVSDMATRLGWSEITTQELAQFKSGAPSEVAYGWDAPIGERAFRVAVTQGPLSPSQAEQFPDFSGGVSTSCTLVLDGFDGAEKLLSEVGALAGKSPLSENVESGGLFTTTWAGGNEEIKVFLVAKADAQKLGTLINVVLLTK